MLVQSYIVIQERNRIMDVVDTEPRWTRDLYRGGGDVMEREMPEARTNTLGHGGAPSGLIRESRWDDGSLLVPRHQLKRYYSSLTSIPEDTMSDAYVFNYKDGSPGDDIYRNNKTIIVSSLNCSSCYEKRGFTGRLHGLYPHSNLYRERSPIYQLNRCRWEDRGIPGSLHIRYPPSENLPYVACILTQYAPGRELENNPINQGYLQTSRDQNFIRGVKEDSYDNRLRWFKESITKLVEWVIKSNITSVVFPYNIASAGILYVLWKADYQPHLQEAAAELQLHNISCVILDRWWTCDEPETKLTLSVSPERNRKRKLVDTEDDAVADEWKRKRDGAVVDVDPE